MVMDIEKILDYKLISFEHHHITVFNLVALAAIYLVTRLILLIAWRLIQRGAVEEKARRRSAFQLLKYVIWVMAISLMLENIGFQLSILIAGSAALLVGVGLGLQQIFNDLVSGLFLLYEGTIKIGDIIEVNGLVGRVEQIHLRTSVILSRDGVNIIVPNHKFITEDVINWSHNNPYKRFDVTVGVDYSSDLEQVKKVLLACASEHPEVIDNMEGYTPSVRITDFGDNSINFQLLFWSKNIFYIEKTRSEIRFSIGNAFRKEGVNIPFPQRDLHIRTVPDGFGKKEEQPDKE